MGDFVVFEFGFWIFFFFYLRVRKVSGLVIYKGLRFREGRRKQLATWDGASGLSLELEVTWAFVRVVRRCERESSLGLLVQVGEIFLRGFFMARVFFG